MVVTRSEERQTATRDNGRVEQPWIVTPDAEQALDVAHAAIDRDPLRLGALLERSLGLTPEHRASVLTQLALEERAAARWREPAADLRFTREGLEQATRPALASWRARRLASHGVRTIADLGCGLGLESRAFVAAGIAVRAVERDQVTASLAAHNCPEAVVRLGDVTDPETLAWATAGADAVFLDPARRDPAAPRTIEGRTGHRISAPASWSPPWPWILELAERIPRAVVKVAPGIDHGLIPTSTSAIWASVDGDLVEASIWFEGFDSPARRTALALRHGSDGTVHEHLIDDTMPVEEAVTPFGAHLIDAAPVITTSGLVTALAARLGATRIDPHIGFLTSDAPPEASPFHTAYRVLEVLPFDRRRVGAALAAVGCGTLTVMKRGVAADTEALRRVWLRGCSGGRALVVALSRIGDAQVAILAEA